MIIMHSALELTWVYSCVFNIRKISCSEFLEVDPSKFTYALINAVQEKQEMMEGQKKELTELEKENAIQQAEIEALKKIEELLVEK